MGKAKKVKPSKPNPTGIVVEEDLELSNNERPIQSILDQIQSPNPEDKMVGLQALSMLCQNEQNIKSIVDSEIVRIVAPFLIDNDENMRHAAAGAIRNLSAISVEICENLVEQDLFTPLLALLNQYTSNDWVPTFEKHLNQLDQKSDTFLQAINIVWNLCESTSIALDCFNQSLLLQSFVRCLNHEVFGMDIAISVGQCLLVISEDNANAWKVLSNFSGEFIALLTIEGDYQSVILKTVAAGIMANVPALLMPNLNKILFALSKTIDINHRPVLGKISSDIPLDETENMPPMEIVNEDIADMENESDEAATIRRRKDELPTELELQVKHVGCLLSAQRIASEVLSNICTPDDGEWEEDMEELSDAESVHDYDTTQPLNSSLQNADKVPVEVMEAIKSLGIVEKLWARAQPLPENVSQILRESEKGLWKRHNLLRISALLCLHNFCTCMSTEDLGGSEAVYNVWLVLGRQIFENDENLQSLEASTSLMRATLEHLKSNRELFKQITESDLQLILDGVKVCTESTIRANWLRMLGTLGCLLTEPFVKTISNFILETGSQEQDVWTLSEALDSFMDMFSDNDYDQIVYDLNIVAKTRELEKVLKTKSRQQKRELGDRFPAISTVKTNLARFCKYLESQQKSFVPNKEM